MGVRPQSRTSIIVSIKILLILIIVAWATNSAAQNVSYTGEGGGLNRTTNELLTTPKGFSKTTGASAAGTSCGSPVTFGLGSVANTVLTGGDIIFDVQVNTTATTPGSTSCFTVTFFLSTSISSQTTYGPVYLATGSTNTAGQAIDCKFDLGSTTLPPPPFSYKLAVQ